MNDLLTVAAACWLLHHIKHSAHTADPPARPFWSSDTTDPGD